MFKLGLVVLSVLAVVEAGNHLGTAVGGPAAIKPKPDLTPVHIRSNNPFILPNGAIYQYIHNSSYLQQQVLIAMKVASFNRTEQVFLIESLRGAEIYAPERQGEKPVRTGIQVYDAVVSNCALRGAKNFHCPPEYVINPRIESYSSKNLAYFHDYLIAVELK